MGCIERTRCGGFFRELRKCTARSLFDLVVSIAWATIYVTLFGRTDRRERSFLLRGLVFGAAVMVVMRWLVVPLGHAVSPPATLSSIANLLAAHILSLGITIAYVASRIKR